MHAASGGNASKVVIHFQQAFTWLRILFLSFQTAGVPAYSDFVSCGEFAEANWPGEESVVGALSAVMPGVELSPAGTDDGPDSD